MPFKRLPQEDCRRAIGPIEKGMPDHIRAALEPGTVHRRMPNPGPDDWLATRKGRGQSYKLWMNSAPNVPDHEPAPTTAPRDKPVPGDFTVRRKVRVRRNKIYLVPLGDIEDAVPIR